MHIHNIFDMHIANKTYMYILSYTSDYVLFFFTCFKEDDMYYENKPSKYIYC